MSEAPGGSVKRRPRHFFWIYEASVSMTTYGQSVGRPPCDFEAEVPRNICWPSAFAIVLAFIGGLPRSQTALNPPFVPGTGDPESGHW